MKQLHTTAIVLKRTDYGEADRIVTLLTPDYGKLTLMARGVRKPKSKLAGGIELFSVSDISFITGRGEIGTLISTRLKMHYGHIVKDIERVQLGYELIRSLNKTTEDQPEAEYFKLLEYSFASLDEDKLSIDLIKAWFYSQLLKQAGHSPNLSTDTDGHKLDIDTNYVFDFDAMTFSVKPRGNFRADHIKTLRLLFSNIKPMDIRKVEGVNKMIAIVLPAINMMSVNHLRV